MVKKKKFVFGIFFLSILGIFIMSIIYASTLFSPFIATSTSTGINYHSEVCVYKNKWNGKGYDLPELLGCSHNVLFNAGQNMTRNLLGQGGNSILNISLCNASGSGNCAVPAVGGGEAFTALAGCGMLATAGTYTSVGTSGGNWSVANTFTSTCNEVVTNVTRLTNSSGGALGIFAGNSFTLANLSNSDSLTVNWSISVT